MKYLDIWKEMGECVITKRESWQVCFHNSQLQAAMESSAYPNHVRINGNTSNTTL